MKSQKSTLFGCCNCVCIGNVKVAVTNTQKEDHRSLVTVVSVKSGLYIRREVVDAEEMLLFY